MRTRTRGRRWTASIAIALAALAAAVLPTSPAHAAYAPDQPVYLQAYGGGQLLARVTGTIGFDDGNRFRYSLRLCWQHSYPAPNLWVRINRSFSYGPPQTGSASESGCQTLTLHSEQRDHGSAVTTVRLEVVAGWFNNQNQYQQDTDWADYDNPYN